jgi:uncharacterized protein (TIGR00369 family)
VPKDFGYLPDPDNPGWQVRKVRSGRFNDLFGDVWLLVEDGRHARLRVSPQPSHLNVNDDVHGGFLLALIDHAIFACPAAIGIPGSVGGVTIDLSTQFLRAVSGEKPVDAAVEVMRETGRMVFMRGLIEQEGAAAVSFSAVIRKGADA